MKGSFLALLTHQHLQFYTSVVLAAVYIKSVEGGEAVSARKNQKRPAPDWVVVTPPTELAV